MKLYHKPWSSGQWDVGGSDLDHFLSYLWILPMHPPCSLFPVLSDINDGLQGPRAWLSQKMEGAWISRSLPGRQPPKVVTLTRNICTGFLYEKKLIFIVLSHKNIAVCYRNFLPILTIFQSTPQLKQHSSSWTWFRKFTPWGQALHCKIPGQSKYPPQKEGEALIICHVSMMLMEGKVLLLHLWR